MFLRTSECYESLFLIPMRVSTFNICGWKSAIRQGLINWIKENKIDILINHLSKLLKSKKTAILAGDFNIAHKEVDLARPKENKGNIMFTLKDLDISDHCPVITEINLS